MDLAENQKQQEIEQINDQDDIWSIDKIDKKIKLIKSKQNYLFQIRQEDDELRAKGIKQFWILDYRRQESYRVNIHNDQKCRIYKYKDPITEFLINDIAKIIEDIDIILEPTETTHRFISQQEIQAGINGDDQILKFIFQDLFNDELRRIELFKKLNIPEPEKKFWIK